MAAVTLPTMPNGSSDLRLELAANGASGYTLKTVNQANNVTDSQTVLVVNQK